MLSTARNQLYYGDYNRCVIRRIDLATSKVYTVAGKSTATSTSCGNFVTGGNATSSAIANPSGLALDPTQNKIYFSQDDSYARVDVLDLESSTLGRLAGNNGQGFLGDGEISTGSQVWSPAQLTTDSRGLVYIPDAVRRPAVNTLLSHVMAGLVHLRGELPACNDRAAWVMPSAVTGSCHAAHSAALHSDLTRCKQLPGAFSAVNPWHKNVYTCQCNDPGLCWVHSACRFMFCGI